MLQFLKFQKSYGDFPVLCIENFSIERGIYWIKGINGSGKSTLLKAIAGILHFEGDIILNSNTALKKHRIDYCKKVNFAEAEPLFPDFLTGYEMIKLFKAAKNASSAQVDYLIESMKIQSYVNQPIGTYSSGMLKKLSVALAFMGNPDLILLDEPCITMDTESLKTLYIWITDRYKQHKTSFILSSHQSLDIKDLTSENYLLIDQKALQFESRI